MTKKDKAQLDLDLQSLDENVLIDCRDVGICYRKPFKLGSKHSRADREFWPFKNLNLRLERGKTLGVMGRNGSGKSTLLRMLAGVTLPDSGKMIRRPGLSVQLLNVNLGFERQLTGRENVVMAGMLLGLSRSKIRSRVDAIHEFSGLGSFFDEPVYAYSSGMVARLGFSIAIEADPDVLLLDEVLSVGDKEFKSKSRDKTRELISSGKSVVLVSHDQQTHDDFCDEVIELSKAATFN